MKNLNPLNRKKIYFDEIVNGKTIPATVARLKAISTRVDKEYKTYSRRARTNSLNLFDTSAFSGADLAYLEGCYSKNAAVVNLKEKIRDAQDIHLRNFCNYCMVGTSDTFDHYIPKTPFPEFSVLSTNLLPACDYCNRKKSTRWKNAANERLIINFYYDQIPILQFLTCSITMQPTGPIALFSLHNPGINANTYNLIERHFFTLELLDRIHSFCPTEIYKIGQSIQPLVGRFSRVRIATFLRDQSNIEKENYGINYCWAILKEELANSAPYLASIGF